MSLELIKINGLEMLLKNKIAIGDFQVQELIKYHPKSIVEIRVDSNEEKEKFINSKIDKFFFSKVVKNQSIHCVAFFTEYKMNFDNSPILIIDSNIDLKELGTIIRTAICFNIKNIAIIGNDFDIFDETIIRTSQGAFFQCNILVFEKVIEVNKNYKNKILQFNIDTKYPSLEIANELYKFYISNLIQENR